MASTMFGTVGVATLLAAFVFNLAGVLGSGSHLYHAFNVIGAGLSTFASALIGFLPFVVLETVWALAALAALAGGISACPARSRRSKDTAVDRQHLRFTHQI